MYKFNPGITAFISECACGHGTGSYNSKTLKCPVCFTKRSHLYTDDFFNLACDKTSTNKFT